MRRLTLRRERFPMRGTFTISRGSRTESEVVVAEIAADGVSGRGECVPYARYGESAESVMAQIEAQAPALAAGLGRRELEEALPAGAARNALDCALWDLEAKEKRVPVWRLAGIPEPKPVVTAYTLSLASAAMMGEAAAANAQRPLLKIKLGGEGDIARVEAVRARAPRARLIVDANEAWTPEMLPEYLPALARLGVALVEQPLPAGRDEALARLAHRVPVAADESCHTSADAAGLVGRYDVVNVKLDKAGGLSEALRLVRAAEALRLGIMVGCMVGTSLAMAPALMIAGMAAFVDLDGPLLLARDRDHGLVYEDGRVHPPVRELWG
ncbi:MAG TPA: N-acetyl-D-Glu racemase DgcA [Alphaproteobacteria bacterium]|nr:N-acetyl-D-Glu racemase DgcA [Alphaproteobacteria bacterium]